MRRRQLAAERLEQRCLLTTLSIDELIGADSSQQIEVPVSIDQVSGMLGFKFDLGYDTDRLIFDGAEIGGMLSQRGNWGTNLEVTPADEADGMISIVSFEDNPFESVDGGEFLKLKFTPQTLAGETKLDILNTTTVNEDTELGLTDGSVLVHNSTTKILSVPRRFQAGIGSTVQVPVMVADEPEWLSGLIVVTYDEDTVSATKVTRGENGSDLSMEWNVNESGVVRIAMFSQDRSPRNGEIALIQFQVDQDAQKGDLADIMFTSETQFEEGRIDLATVDGSVEVTDLLADVDVIVRRMGAPNPFDPTTGEATAALQPTAGGYIDEWTRHWVEIWIQSQDQVTAVTAGSLTLEYREEVFTARVADVEYGPAFSSDQNTVVDDDDGTVELSAGTSLTDVGDDQPVLFARVAFDVTDSDTGVPHNAFDKYISSEQSGLGLIEAAVDLGGGSGASVTPNVANVELWPVMYDIVDNGSIDFADLSKFAEYFLRSVSEDPNVYAADFTRTGSVDFADLSLFGRNFLIGKDSATRIQYADDFPEIWRDSGQAAAAAAYDDGHDQRVSALAVRDAHAGAEAPHGDEEGEGAVILSPAWIGNSNVPQSARESAGLDSNSTTPPASIGQRASAFLRIPADPDRQVWKTAAPADNVESNDVAPDDLSRQLWGDGDDDTPWWSTA